MASRPSLLLPGLGPFLQHMQNITFQTESRVTEQEKEFQSPKYIFHSFMERLWAYLTIQQLLEQMWVARTPDGPLGKPHMARASSQAFPCGGGATGSAGTGYLPGIERGGGGIWVSSRLSQWEPPRKVWKGGRVQASGEDPLSLPVCHLQGFSIRY